MTLTAACDAMLGAGRFGRSSYNSASSGFGAPCLRRLALRWLKAVRSLRQRLRFCQNDIGLGTQFFPNGKKNGPQWKLTEVT